MIERLHLTRLLPHVIQSPNYNPLQSANRKMNSTETALLKLVDDMCDAVDAGRSTLLVALDMSAAFDTIEHDTLLKRLDHSFSISGDALKWLKSYLDQRSSFVQYGPDRSTTTPCDFDVPHDSSPGPLLIMPFIAPLAYVVASHVIRHHQHADGMQIYITSTKNEFSNGISTLLACTNRIYAWITNNGLALNPSKSEAIVFQGPRCAENVVKDVIVAGSNITISLNVKSLGVVLDKKLSFDKHDAGVCRVCYFHIRALRNV